MDSLSQIVLGAAVGEAVLGRRLGNRAMIWGAVAGTIPDMDVLGKYFLSELDNLAFHRGISHSFLFCVFGALLFGWVTDRLYRSRYHAWIATVTQAAAAIVVGFVVDFLTQIFAPGAWWPVALYVLLVGFLGGKHLQKRYFRGDWKSPNTDAKGWMLLFFWGFLTHVLLDCFTTYGTQVFAPFSDQRVAWGTVSVVDPLYTFPFLVCLLLAARCAREDVRRRFWNGLGLGWSVLYLAFTVVNCHNVHDTIEDALKTQEMPIKHFLTTPTIFNNLLWNVVVDSGDEFLLAQYSIFDEVPIAFHAVPKGYNLLHNLQTDETLGVIDWFSSGYFNAIRRDDGSLQLNDLRFGTFSGKAENADDYIFRFKLIDRGPVLPYGFERAQGGPPDEKAEDLMLELFDRAAGIAAEELP